MLATHFFSKSLSKTKLVLPYQWLNITFLAIRSNSSTSGSSSSDSDSDSDSRSKNTNEKSKDLDYLRGAQMARKRRQIEKQVVEAAQVLNESPECDKEKILSTLLSRISEIKNENKGNADQRESKRNEGRSGRKFIKKEFQETLISDKRKPRYDTSTEPSIIQMLKSQEERLKSEKIEKPRKMVDESPVIRMLKNQQRKGKSVVETIETNVSEKIGRKQETSKEPSIIHMLRNQQRNKRSSQNYDRTETNETPEELSVIRRKKRNFDDRSNQTYEATGDRTVNKKYWASDEPSIINMLISQDRSKKGYEIPREEMNMKLDFLSRLLSPDYGTRKEDTGFSDIFVSEFKENPDTPALTVWNMCEQRELESMVKFYPRNALQEMINWTNEGKLWRFPIDNEQGMETEQRVHFSKHVFLERHLSPWCPTKGPIRHFMELVCCGLSKNPYLTITEKRNHIMWYKDYFNDKQDLLDKLGLVE
ncbi:uncharacterized protein LOC108631951 [Ceratina calcarata]|uniref:Small ribosomal subunit protein mS31 n=1 Tax=Ceratina calcarata TaxID=156304 RepID=A0AAJ7NET5_9HYME|nr:uncharacterized protein LOC108631951 [Ceratina calcarata]